MACQIKSNQIKSNQIKSNQIKSKESAELTERKRTRRCRSQVKQQQQQQQQQRWRRQKRQERQSTDEASSSPSVTINVRQQIAVKSKGREKVSALVLARFDDSSRAKVHCDSDDAQTICQAIWLFQFVVGTRQKAELSMSQQLDKEAQEFYQHAFVDTVKYEMRRTGGRSLSCQPRQLLHCQVWMWLWWSPPKTVAP
jgi:hypothetical protein